jgi:hypothetical protein
LFLAHAAAGIVAALADAPARAGAEDAPADPIAIVEAAPVRSANQTTPTRILRFTKGPFHGSGTAQVDVCSNALFYGSGDFRKYEVAPVALF